MEKGSFATLGGSRSCPLLKKGVSCVRYVLGVPEVVDDIALGRDDSSQNRCRGIAPLFLYSVT